MGWASKMAKILAVLIGLIALIGVGSMLSEELGGGFGEQRNCVGSVFAGKAPSCNVSPGSCMSTLLNGKHIGNVFWDGNNFKTCK